MTKVLVLGAGGMAGHVIATHLSELNYDVTTLSANNKLDNKTILLDVTDFKSLSTFLDRNTFDIIINGIGVLVKKSEERKDIASLLNAYLPHFLENYCKNLHTRVIHLSTDCVFSGEHAPYTEQSSYDGKLFYDQSKALGEIINESDLTFRMSIIGPDMNKEGVGLFNWFFHQTGNIEGYKKALWNGITTIELAKGIDAAIKQNLTGLYHLVPERNISKFDLINEFIKAFNRDDINLLPSEKPMPNKTLVNTRKDFNYTVKDYPDMIKEMKEWIDARPHLYPNYGKK